MARVDVKEAEQIRALGMRAPIVVIPNGLNLKDYAVASSKDAPIETPWLGPLKKEGRRVLFLDESTQRRVSTCCLRSGGS